MKLLKINIAFRLPDDFDGGFEDAFEMLSEYRRQNRGKSPIGGGHQIPDDSLEILSKSEKVMINLAMKDFADGLKTSGVGGVYQITPDNKITLFK
jgi:hypothetical protein